MFEIYGAYTTAKVYAEQADQSAVSQIAALCNQPFAEGAKIRIMPDVHAGMGCTIGTTMTVTDKAVPNMVGVDIGCGMETVRLRETHFEPQKLDKLIRAEIPSGFDIRRNAHRFAENTNLEQLYCLHHIQLEKARCSIGTLGGGNHFIEVDRGSDGSLYLVIHSGSRHLGVETASWYQNEAFRRLNCSDAEAVRALTESLKAQGRQRKIEAELKKLKNTKRTYVPKLLAYCEGALFEQYLHDMEIVQGFALQNRLAMVQTIVKGMKWHVEEQFSTIHNYIDMEHRILRKGAVSAQAGEKLLIPINMRDGSLLCMGKGNPEWNYSAPHGAGRLCSRSEAKERFTLSEYKKQMEGIYSTSVGRGTLDECPMAYKDMASIVSQIAETADILDVLKPVYNFKAGGETD